MHTTPRFAAWTVAAIIAVVGLDRGHARQAPAPTHGPRGGTLVRTAHYRFEVFGYPTGLRVFVTDRDGAAVNAAALRGTVTFFHPNSPEPWFSRPLRPPPSQPGAAAESLDLAMNLASVPASGSSVKAEINGLPDPKEKSARFTVPFSLVAGPSDEAKKPDDEKVHPPPGAAIHYFPAAGFYRTAEGAVIWVPNPGYYYGTSVQYYPHLQASGWQYARPAPDPSQGTATTATSSSEGGDSIHPELYWRPRAFGDTESYQNWLHGAMWRERLAGVSPSSMGGECARCHR